MAKNNRHRASRQQAAAPATKQTVYAATQEGIPAASELFPSTPRANRGVLFDVASSIFEPGVNHGVMVVIHGAFGSLFLVQLWLLYLTDGTSVHVWLLTLLNMILYPAVLWFVHEAYKHRPDLRGETATTD